MYLTGFVVLFVDTDQSSEQTVRLFYNFIMVDKEPLLPVNEFACFKSVIVQNSSK